MHKSLIVVCLLTCAALVAISIGCEEDTSTVIYKRDTDSGNASDADADADTDVDGDADTDTDADADSDSDSDSEPSSICEDVPYSIELQDINMLILLDRSQSMTEFSFTDTGLTFEQVADSALIEVVKDPANGLVNFGLSAFPTEACVRVAPTKASQVCYPADSVIVPVGPNKGPEIESHLLAMDTCGGTPIAASLRWAKTYLETQLPPDMKDNPSFVLLATDGAPNCSPNFQEGDQISTECVNTNPGQALSQGEQCLDDVASITAAGELMAINVPTYVVGVGDQLTSWAPVMNGIANAGGGVDNGSGSSTHFFPAGDTAAVTAAFKDIVAQATPCTFPVEWAEIPVTSSQKSCGLVKAKLVENGVVPDPATELPFSANCEDPGGWHFKDLGDIKGVGIDQCHTIELCSQSCNDLRYGVIEGLSFSFGCAPVI